MSKYDEKLLNEAAEAFALFREQRFSRGRGRPTPYVMPRGITVETFRLEAGLRPNPRHTIHEISLVIADANEREWRIDFDFTPSPNQTRTPSTTNSSDGLLSGGR